jgi:molecular chaperone DnaK (HSP70)
MPRTAFLIGIDLGTTNTAVAAVDTRTARPRARVARVAQLTAPGHVEPRPTLPSFLYFPDEDEIASGAVALPWNPRPEAVAGVLARDRGAVAPARQVTSAKSWLAHRDVDRHARFLPWGTTAGNARISPVEASARYLMHLRDAWNAAEAAGDDTLRFERQTIVLTVPASFDEEARELTVEAARAAGLADITLLEEPIAAFYSWMAGRRGGAGLRDDDIALVCDVGGGTTDFSLIRVRLGEGVPAFERIAIGDHLLLGGDNLDLALATVVERRIAETRPSMRLAITQRSALRRLCSGAKERMLGPDPPDRLPITLLGAGRALVGESVTVDLLRTEVEAALQLFLPPADPPAHSRGDRRAGLRELGLPYETDPAITRHFAGFLLRSAAMLPPGHRAVATVGGRPVIRPDVVLFNGGFFTPPAARDLVAARLAKWFGDAPRLLAAPDLESAVAIGAATYARIRAGVGRPAPLVKAGSGRAYYVAVRAPVQDKAVAAICVLARGTNEGTAHAFDRPFTVVTNRPVSFPLYSSTIRSDSAGEVVMLPRDGDLLQHAPLVAVFRYGRKSRQVELPVTLSSVFTPVGTLELWCRSTATDHTWRLQFQAREDPADEEAPESGGGDEAGTIVVADEAVAEADALIRAVFSGGSTEVTPEVLTTRIESILGYAKGSWPLPVIRRLADALLDVVEARRGTASLEARWLNLFGFCVRPGFGAAKDPWRIVEARKIYTAGLIYPNVVQNRVEWLVLWQRAAGGFSAGQQRELALRVMGDVGLAGRRPKGLNPQVDRESWRLLAGLERLDAATRVRIGDEVIARIRRDPDNKSLLWSIGRLGARAPLYGPLTSVVPPADAARWLERLLAIEEMTPGLGAAIVEIGALTGDPLRDLPPDARGAARRALFDAGFGDEAVQPLLEVVRAGAAETSRAFGEPLPVGLRLDATEAPHTPMMKINAEDDETATS